MKRFGSAALLSAALAMSGAGLASATPFGQVFQSHGVYHVQACPQQPAPGTARCHAHIVSDSRGNHLTWTFGRNAMRNVTPSGYSPSTLRSAYKVTATGSPGTVIAIVDAYGYNNAETDMGVYRSMYGLPACTSANGCFAKYNENGVKGNYPTQNVGWGQETALDLDMASAMCPNCKIILIEASSASYADLATAVNTAAALGAHVISNSYGGGEAGTQPYESAYNHPGVAITASSGDSGYGVQFPASSPHVIATGGTSLYAADNSRGWTETAWSDGGSGCSAVYAKPTWQKDPLCTMRMEADLSAVADPSTGVAVYAPETATVSAWMVFGGTSVAAPLIGGIYGANGGSVSYASNIYAHTTLLFDVVAGSNGRCGGTYFCTAGAGYDGPTGFGTPNGSTAF